MSISVLAVAPGERAGKRSTSLLHHCRINSGTAAELPITSIRAPVMQ